MDRGGEPASPAAGTAPRSGQAAAPLAGRSTPWSPATPAGSSFTRDTAPADPLLAARAESRRCGNGGPTP